MSPPAATSPSLIAPARRVGVRRATAAVVAALVLLAACGASSTTGQLLTGKGSRAGADREFLNGAVLATNTFGADLYRTLAADQGNFVTSPTALINALAMVRAGSAGTTRQQFDTVLQAGLTPNLDEGLNTIALELSGRQGDKRGETRRGRIDLRLPAGLWGQRGTHVKDDLVNLLTTDYGTGFHLADFHADAEGSRAAVNNWADEATDGVIKELVPRGDVTQYTRFLAAAAVNLRAPWQVPFAADRTHTDRFIRADGTTTDARMMETSGVVFRAATGTGWRAIELPYLGDELALDIVLPAAGTLPAFEQSLTGNRLREITATLDVTAAGPLAISLPQFAFTTTRDLQDPLTKLGLTDAFSHDADFSGVTSDEVLSLSNVVYQGFFKVDEEGTDPNRDTVTAQPATEPSVAGANRIVVDRPFTFVLRDRVTGVVLLMGRVATPN